MLENSVSSFLEKAASRSPAPGGGCVAALAGALGASMACMSANFTAGKKGYENVGAEAAAILKSCESAMLRLSRLAEDDIAGYEKVSAAYKLPARTEEEKNGRKERLGKALMEAMRAPFETASLCRELIGILPRLAEIGNKNLISDVGVAACMLQAALESAALNVEINLKAIGDDKLTAEKRGALGQWLAESSKIARGVLARVEGEIKA